MSDSGMAQFVEVLSVARVRTTLDGVEIQPAVVALTTGCSARVEVVNERLAAVEAEPGAAPPAASERHRTTVEIDLLGQQQSEQAEPKVADKQPVAVPEPMPRNLGGIQINGDGNTIEFHFHRHRRSRSPALIYPVMRHEMVIVPSDSTAPVVFMDNAPPRMALVDEQVARAYAEQMLKLTREEHR